jgi:hypothetical protein
VFYPYVASKDDKDPIARLVGHHHYIKGNPKYHHDYNDPLSKGLHPLYIVLPPFKDVLLIRVQDGEGGAEERDVFTGAYLSIKNGVVVDQLNEGCHMTADYTCVDRDGKKLFRLLETGKFSQH